MSYVVCLETDREIPDEEAFRHEMDAGLRKKLVQYDVYRNKLLTECGLKVMKAGWSEHMMKKLSAGNATVAQVKVPVVVDELPEDF